VREALFNILGPPADAAWVLDLYAGSGALGIEALSRGAQHAVFVDADARACQQIRDNLRSLGLSARGTVLCGRVLSLLPQLASRPFSPFSWVFADPPYASDEPAQLLSRLARGALLANDAVLVCERATRDADSLSQAADQPALQGLLTLTDRRRYGDTALLFFSKTPSSAQPMEGP
jgi:16S rRNA (guanine(966)-N(2))-methyltransferase RsmD